VFLYAFDLLELGCQDVRSVGPDYGLVSMRLDLAVGCPRIPAPSIHEHCGVCYPDLVGDVLERERFRISVKREA
jgi:hypothetical protein